MLQEIVRTGNTTRPRRYPHDHSIASLVDLLQSIEDRLLVEDDYDGARLANQTRNRAVDIALGTRGVRR